MKKILLTICSLLLPQIVFAQGAWYVPPIHLPNFARWDNIYDVISFFINLLIILAGIITIIYLIFSGYKYITAGGNPEQAAAAKSGILAALIGLIIIWSAWAITSYIMDHLAGTIPVINVQNNLPER